MVWTLPLGYVGRVLGYSPVRSPGAGQAVGRHGPGEGLPVPFHFLTAHSSHVWAMCPQLGWECAREGPCSLPLSLLASLALALQLSCFPLLLTPFRAVEALNRRSEHHLMQMKKAIEKAQGNQITSPMSDSECVALSEIVQQSPTCCPSPCVFDQLQISSKLPGKNQYQFYPYTCFLKVFLQPNKQNLLCLKLSDCMCLFPELYIAICILTHTKRHGQAPNMLALIAI